MKLFEWRHLANLLAKGYPLLDALHMIHQEIDISAYLGQGMDVKDIFLQGHSGRFYTHLSFFMSLSSLSEAIYSALDMEDFEQGIRKKLIKQTSYPLLLFIFAFVTLYIFSSFIIPQMMQSFDMEQESILLTRGVVWLKTITYILFFSLIIICLVGLWCIHHPTTRFSLFDKLLRFTSLPADLCSYTLSGYFIQLQTHGLATNQAIACLLNIRQDTLLYRSVSQIHKRLSNGEELITIFEEHPYINDDLIQCWRIGMYTQNMQDAMMEMMKRQEELWFLVIKKISVGIQAGAYSFVAIMVLLVYQIMLVPLQILETM